MVNMGTALLPSFFNGSIWLDQSGCFFLLLCICVCVGGGGGGGGERMSGLSPDWLQSSPQRTEQACICGCVCVCV